MANRDFSDSVKLSVITDNLRKNDGLICCAICGTKLSSISECHFDHIFPYAKGGKSSADNCQILCVNCNLKKNDKELQDFLLEEKAKQFFAGKTNEKDSPANDANETSNADGVNDSADTKSGVMTKALFDQIIADFVARKGGIHKVDFGREYNHLPSIHYVHLYYGSLGALQAAFGVDDPSASWNRETIREALVQYLQSHDDIIQKDLTKKNRLPSLPCILRYYPEYSNFTEIKRDMLGLRTRMYWDRDSVLQAGREYVKRHGKITEAVLRSENNLPTNSIIYRYFGSLAAYQQAVGSVVSQVNEFISLEDIEEAVNRYFGGREREIESMSNFFESFQYSPSTIHKRFGSFETFCTKHGITVKKAKKAKYSKQEVDDAIAKWVKAGKEMPTAQNLSKLGLPSLSVILKYYEDWKEPFVLYRKLYEKLN